jgi:soluble lytic murein transglycosylase-like protein
MKTKAGCAAAVAAASLWTWTAVGAATTERPDAALRALLIEAVSESRSFDDRFEAEVWLTDMSSRLGNSVESPQERVEILRQVHLETTRARLNPELVLAVIQVESNFDRFAISRAGAQGLMQIMPFWLKEIGRPGDNLFHIGTNLRLGCTILKYYLDLERGHMARALARYNGSAGESWYPMRVFEALRNRWYRQ